MTQQAIVEEILAERVRQRGKGYNAFSDNAMSAQNWYEIIADYNAWARRMATMGSPLKARRRYIQLAALAVAAVEALDKGRHDY